MTEVSVYLLLLITEVPKAEVSKISSYPQEPMHLILVAFLFYISVAEWGEASKQVDFSTVGKFVAVQTAFHCGSQQSLISLHHWEIWSQMCLSLMGVALSTWVYFASQSTLVYLLFSCSALFAIQLILLVPSSSVWAALSSHFCTRGK